MDSTAIESQQIDATAKIASPMMLQWQACKQAAGDALLLFRMGDFYEAFHEDAATVAQELDLTLTKRQDIPMSGMPHHSSEAYIDKLVSKGYRVAIAEQTEDPKKAKGLVKREVVRVITPGTLMTSSLLSDKTNNFIAAVSRVGSIFGLAVLDLTTADFRVSEFDNEQELLNEIFRLHPSEFLTSVKFKDKHPALFTEIKQNYDCLVNTYEDWHFEHQVAHDFLTAHFGVHNLDGFGLRGMLTGINAAGGLLHYLQEILCLPINHIQEVRTYSTAQYMSLDRNTQRNLELTEPLHESSRKHTLLKLLDRTKTPMGARLMRQWIKQPLLSVSDIQQRQDAVEAFYLHPMASEQLDQLLHQVRDIERLMIRICSACASPRDLVALRLSFDPIGRIKEMLKTLPQTALIWQEEQKLDSLPDMNTRIARAIIDEPPLRISDGNIIRDGYNKELDELRAIGRDSQTWLANYQTKLREETGIKTMKVGFNRLSGYFIEVSKGQADRMPDTFVRRQTLTNAERFITPELKDYESKMLTAEDRISAIENELFIALRDEIAQYAPQVMRIAQALARIDCLRSLGDVARQHHYNRPVVDDSTLLTITEGRHPIIEASNGTEKFIPNDTLLDAQDNRLFIITGPNMAGKSTYIRQVALIAIMAQMGSFVPAQSAHIGVLDKVFTRIGASDDLARGQSTFMVEMTETANILNNATSRSLVILDEIGRGTSTYDGISIAWAVAEQLLLAEERTPKTLFATHYWELTKLEGKIPGAINYNIAVHESPDNIVFLRKIVRGGTDKSYGIHVARLAGLPATVILRAKELLVHLEENANRKTAFEPSRPKRQPPRLKPICNEVQLTFF
ncbi:MAG: DNA mismatch repair protein MutS [Parachlamydiaceae bacterium]|nr:DNA mismatch repair protein MutS [Parachlamydiaceae bacterium]